MTSSDDDIAEAIAQIKAGTFENRGSGVSSIRQDIDMLKEFCKNI